jgi:preprotein translocase subunit SecF
MKKLLYILILGFFACKSTKTNTNNQLDISKETIEKKETRIKVKQIDLNDYEITFHTANEKLPVKITDKKGNTQTFTNVKKATLKQKTEQKKDSVVNQNFTTDKKETDNSKIKESEESVSDAKNFKGIFGYAALIVICLTAVFLIIRFRIKSKKDISI